MIRLDRFEALADRLEAQPERFDFRTYSASDYDVYWCGTHGCSLGHAVEMFGADCGVHLSEHGTPVVKGDEKCDTHKACVAIFGYVGFDVFSRLFLPDGPLDRDCTAAEAAAEIRKFVAEERAKANP